MKRDKEWLLERIENYIPMHDRTVGDVINGILEIAKKLDEPENERAKELKSEGGGGMRRCEACEEYVEEYDKIILTDDGEVYHEECCSVYSKGYTVYSDGCFVGETENEAMDAWMLLDEDEYR